MLNSRTSHFSRQSHGDRRKGIIIGCLADNSPMYPQYPPNLFFIHFIKHIHFFGVTCGCFRPWSGSGKCIADFLKPHFVFLEIIGCVQVTNITLVSNA